MTNEDFMKFAEEKFVKQLEILGTKGGEYSREKDDRFLNFKRAGAMQNISTIAALLGQLSKHLASIVDMASSPIDPSQIHIWEEKTGDALINYLVLLDALIKY